MLYRWEKQVKEGGTRNEKLLEISKYVMKQFQNAHLKSIPIHDIDIKRWALNARNEVQLPREFFTASSKWIHNFKIKHGIVSRKINKFTTQTLLSKKDDLVQEANQFVSKIREQISLLGADNVYNSDQSGFNYESHAGRTLSFKGTAQVECLTQSKNSLTHSYTIQPIVSASGLLKSPLFIVLQETGGQFGPVVEMNIYKAENIVVVPSKSGKLSSDLAVQCECLKSELDLFSLSPTQTSIENSQWIQYKPVSTLTDDTSIEFVVPGHGEEYLDLAHTMMCVNVSTIGINGNGATPEEKRNAISRDDYARGYTIFAFDLTSDLSANCVEHWNLVKHGSLRVEIGFEKALTKTINAIVYAEFDNMITIDSSCQVIVDFAG
nr:PREDICTED: uncharacterized protein LOC105669005 [Linepithema humile]